MSNQDGKSKGLFELKGQFVSERLSSDLREQIESGELKYGAVVKPVRELMKQYGISYNSVRKALNQLAEEGYITLEQGRGTFVKGSKVPRSDRALSDDKQEVTAESLMPPIEVEESPVVDVEPMPLDETVTSTLLGAAAAIESVGEGGESEEIHVSRAAPAPVVKPITSVDLDVFVAPDMALSDGSGLAKAVTRFLALSLAGGRTARVTPVEPGRLAECVQKGGARGISLWGLPIHQRDLEVLTVPGRACVSVGYWPAKGELSGVMPDNFGAAYELGGRLVPQGHRDVAFVGMRRAHGVGHDARERLSGCRVAWEETGIALEESSIIGATVADDWLADRLLALKPRPTAVVVSEQKLAEVLIAQLKERGLQVPRALSVVSFGAKDEPNPLDITSMRVDWQRAAQCAWNRLKELLAGAPPERLRIGLPAEYHQGSTTCSP